MKTTIETLTFPCEVIDKIKIKTSFKNLNIRFVSGHIIKFNKTNLSIREPHKIIISNSYNTLVALLYDDTNKIYIPNDNAVITLSKFIQIINWIWIYVKFLDTIFRDFLILRPLHI